MDTKNIHRDSFFFFASLFSKTPPTFTTTTTTTTATTTLHGGNNNKWSTLPKFILYYLLKFLSLRTDLPRLRSICTSWRSNLPLTQIPIIPLGFDSPALPHSTLPILLHHSTFYLFSNSPEFSPWIARVADVTNQLDNNMFQLCNPINAGNFFQPDPSLSGRVELFRDIHHLFKLSSCYSLSSDCSCVSEKAVGNWDFNSKYLFAVLAKVKNLGLVYLKMGKLEWTEVKNMEVSTDEKFNYLEKFDVGDIVFYDGEFFAFDVSSWKSGIIDPNDDDFDNVSSIEFIDGPRGVEYHVLHGVDFVRVNGDLFAMKGVHFVLSKDGLYLVFEVSVYDREDEGLVVFELDEDEWDWNRVESIGEQVFFIGRDVAFSVSSEKLPLWKSGSVCLFTRSSMAPYLNDVMEVGKGELPEGLEMLDSIKYQKYWRGFGFIMLRKII